MLRFVHPVIKEIVDVATEQGVKLAIEPTHPVVGRDRSFIHRLKDAADFIAPYQHQMGIVFDTYHLSAGAENLRLIETIAPFVSLVQIADASTTPVDEQNRCFPGTGNLPITEVIEAFCENDYAGFFELEMFGESLELLSYESILNQSIRSTQRLVGPIAQKLRIAKRL